MLYLPLAKSRRVNPVILALTLAMALLFVSTGHSYAQGSQPLAVDSAVLAIITTIEVTNTGDSGPGTLRDAIEAANANAGTDFITFNIPGDGPHTFHPTSPYTALTGGTIINGYTQPGSVEATASSPAVLKLELDGTGAGDGANGLLITGGGTTIRGLVINRFDGAGIRMETIGGNTVEGNYIGTDVTGSLDLGNGSVGVWVYDVPSNRIGGSSAGARNVISGNDSTGVFIYKSGSTSNVVLGNYIGTDASGTVAMANYEGVSVSGASDNTIGGVAAGARNVISGNRFSGVKITRFSSFAANGNLVQGNYIGTNANGDSALGNGRNGVYLLTTSGNTIGGAEPGAGNVVSGNGFGSNNTGDEKNGVHIRGNGFEAGDLLLGNYIGTNAAGTAAIPNMNNGILLDGARYHTIGGSLTAGTGNLISGNHCGIKFVIDTGAVPWVHSSDITITGNRIGTDAAGMAAIGNSCGIAPGGENNVIGGTISGQGNLISGNNTGISMSGPSTVDNLVHGNLIGTDITGNGPLGNTGSGITFINGANGNTIGGTATGTGNTIAFNSGPGIQAYAGTVVSSGELLGESVTNRVIGNSFHDNTELAIDLGRDGVTANDDGLDDSDPGNYQNYPVLSANAGGTIQAVLQSNANSQFRVEFFSNQSCDPSGHGEGRIYLGARILTTDGSGSAVATFDTNASVGEYITATATGPGSNTSEFSACLQITEATATPPSGSSGTQTELDFGNSGGSMGGSGDFSKFVPKNDRAIIGTIPVGIKNLVIELTAENDLDIELWDGDTFVVGWQSNGVNAQIYSATEVTGGYNSVKITWSGWNGVGGKLGNEYIKLNGTTANSFVMKAFGYQAGAVKVVYSWEGTGGDGPAPSGKGSFSKKVPLNDRATIGTIPKGIEDLYIQLAATADLDIELWDGDTFVVGWQSDGVNAQLYSSTEVSGVYNGVNITWSGWNGVGGNRGDEYIRITGVTGNSFVMKVFAFKAGSVDVVYTWGPGS